MRSISFDSLSKGRPAVSPAPEAARVHVHADDATRLRAHNPSLQQPVGAPVAGDRVAASVGERERTLTPPVK